MIDPVQPTPSKSNNLTDQTIFANSQAEVVMDCSATGIPTPNINWFKDDKLITVGIKS